MGDSSDSGLTDSLTITQLIGIICTVAILFIGLLLPPPAGITVAIQRTLTVFAMTIVLWIAKPVPYVVSSILSVTLLFVFGVTDSFAEAATGFSETLFFFLLLLLLLGHSISKVGLDELAAQRMLSATSTPDESVRSLSINLLGLSFLMPSAVARTVTFIPVVRQIAEMYQLGSKSNFERSSFFILGHVNPIASMALMTGGGMAIITSEVIRSSVREITWVEWAIYMIPPVVVLYALAAFSATRLYPVNDSATVSNDWTADGGVSSSGSENETAEDSIGRDQRIVALVMGGTVLAWIIGSFIGVPTIFPAAAAVVVLSLPMVQIITPEDIRSLNWEILFVIGAMFSILEVMNATGTLSFIVGTITQWIPFGDLSLWQTIAILLSIAVVMRTFFSTASAAITVVLPVVLEFATVLGVNQFYLALSILLVVGSTTFLPFNTTAVLVSFDQGPLTMRDVLSFGLITMIYAIIVIPLSWLFYWPVIDSLL